MILLYLAAMFAAFIAVAYFVFDSVSAVRALLVTALGALVGAVPGVLSRVEYRVTGEGLLRRRVSGASQADFRLLFRWEDLSHVRPTGSGFKYFTRSSERPLRRFMQLHVLGGHAGELHVETPELQEVRSLLRAKGIPERAPPAGGRQASLPPERSSG